MKKRTLLCREDFFYTSIFLYQKPERTTFKITMFMEIIETLQQITGQ